LNPTRGTRSPITVTGKSPLRGGCWRSRPCFPRTRVLRREAGAPVRSISDQFRHRRRTMTRHCSVARLVDPRDVAGGAYRRRAPGSDEEQRNSVRMIRMARAAECESGGSSSSRCRVRPSNRVFQHHRPTARALRWPKGPLESSTCGACRRPNQSVHGTVTAQPIAPRHVLGGTAEVCRPTGKYAVGSRSITCRRPKCSSMRSAVSSFASTMSA